MIRQALPFLSAQAVDRGDPGTGQRLGIDGVSTQWYVGLLRKAMRRRLVRSLLIFAFGLAGAPAMAQVGTCVTTAGDAVAPWTDGSDPACGADCRGASAGCSVDGDTCGHEDDSTSSFRLNSALAHFKLDPADAVEAIDGPPSEAPICRGDGPLCGPGGPQAGAVGSNVVLILPSFPALVPHYRGGLLPMKGTWPQVHALTDYLETPRSPPPRSTCA